MKSIRDIVETFGVENSSAKRTVKKLGLKRTKIGLAYFISDADFEIVREHYKKYAAIVARNRRQIKVEIIPGVQYTDRTCSCCQCKFQAESLYLRRCPVCRSSARYYDAGYDEHRLML